MPDLTKRERAAEHAQHRRLALGQRFCVVRLARGAGEASVEIGQACLERLGTLRQGGQRLSRLAGQFRRPSDVAQLEPDSCQQEGRHDRAPGPEAGVLPAQVEDRLQFPAGLFEPVLGGIDRRGRRVGHDGLRHPAEITLDGKVAGLVRILPRLRQPALRDQDHGQHGRGEHADQLQ